MIQDSYDAAIPAKVIEKLKERTIYFAHMSVGSNIIDGISSLTDELNIQEIGETDSFASLFLLHSKIGENTKPLLKIKEFNERLESGIGGEIDTAFLKLCYVDISGITDVDFLFDQYQKTYTQIEKQFPDLTIIHFTVPLTTRQKGLKSIIKRIIGRDVRGYEDNLKRQEFNEMIRSHYSTVFDLAEIESTNPDGTRSMHTMNGKTYFSLVPDYTTDGGHLNESAGKMVAHKLLTYISELD